MQITAIEKQRRRQRANVYLDGRYALSLSLELVAQAGLHEGDALSPQQVDSLRQADVRHQAQEAALRLLAYRPRSESEMRQRLARRGLPEEVVQETIARLREQGLLSDAAFARFWVETRDQNSPRGRRLLWREFSAKGIEREIARQAIAAVAEEDAALRAAQKKARHLQGQDYPLFRRRLGDFLLRRGFPYPTVRTTVERLWREGQQGSERP
ncbi:MAG: RecX family transcriptional regulator [Dehalococcoidia bacterium]